MAGEIVTKKWSAAMIMRDNKNIRNMKKVVIYFNYSQVCVFLPTAGKRESLYRNISALKRAGD